MRCACLPAARSAMFPSGAVCAEALPEAIDLR